MYERLRKLLADSFGVPEDRISRDTRLRDLALDSLDRIELIALCEEEALHLPPEAARRLDPERLTVGQLADLLNGQTE